MEKIVLANEIKLAYQLDKESLERFKEQDDEEMVRFLYNRLTYLSSLMYTWRVDDELEHLQRNRELDLAAYPHLEDAINESYQTMVGEYLNSNEYCDIPVPVCEMPF